MGILMIMFGLGPTEILLILSAIILLLVPVAIVVCIVYAISRDRDKRMKALESRIDQLEKEKIMDERTNALEKRLDEIHKK